LCCLFPPTESTSKRPKSKLFPAILATISDHIRKRRAELGLLQKDIVAQFGCSEDSITGWENGRSSSSIEFAPSIIGFLGYYPFPFETHILGGRIKYYRLLNGINLRELAKRLNVDKSTLFAWEANRSRPSGKSSCSLEKLLLSILKSP